MTIVTDIRTQLQAIGTAAKAINGILEAAGVNVGIFDPQTELTRLDEENKVLKAQLAAAEAVAKGPLGATEARVVDWLKSRGFIVNKVA